MSHSLKRVFEKFGKETPGIRCLWVDEFIGELPSHYSINPVPGKIEKDNFSYDPTPTRTRPFHRYFKWFTTTEVASTPSVHRSVFGPRVVIHSIFHE